MKKRVRVAILGTGFIGRVHLEALCRLGFIEVAALVTADQDQADRLAREYGVERVETDYRRVLDDPHIEVVHVCTPTALHAQMVKDALLAGKHVLSEKPLATSVADAVELVELAKKQGVRNCTNHNLRYYPLVQHMRRMREQGELGDILVVQGQYTQDYLLYDTDWNWRLDSKDSGPSCAMADIGSHFCDMTEHITGLRISELCAELNTFHSTRKRPTGWVESFAGKLRQGEQEYEEHAVDTEDYGAVLFCIGERARGSFSAGQVFAGKKNGLRIEVYGTKAAVAWDQERPEELWIGNRSSYNQILLKDPALLDPAARPFADLPAGHAEGYDDTFKNVFRRFYQAVEDPAVTPEYPQFEDGLRQLVIIQAELASSEKHGWVNVPAGISARAAGDA
jgi:predicted dehydrogenase